MNAEGDFLWVGVPPEDMFRPFPNPLSVVTAGYLLTGEYDMEVMKGLAELEPGKDISLGKHQPVYSELFFSTTERMFTTRYLGFGHCKSVPERSSNFLIVRQGARPDENIWRIIVNEKRTTATIRTCDLIGNEIVWRIH